ncbi:MAG: hypothetical protein HKO94_10910 [Flavobacteriaceae bacterium]|nr:hypothetical protein [Flavobacteriaceae bacterium]
MLSSVQLFTAGDTIELKFSTDSSNNPKLYVSNSYGSTLLTAVRENELLVYTIPASFGNKSGIVNWRLTASETDLSGHFYIKPKAAVKSLESYLGPPSIQAGGTDFSMLVVIPTDALDNPLEDSTVVNIKTHFRASEDASEIPTRYFLAYKNIYSPEQTGRILISSESSGVTSKEFDINVLASLPTDFKISEQRNHKYADGNQIVTLSTSKILDRYGNVIEDGTLTEFFIKNQKGAYLKTAGTTVNGVANAQIIHPDQADEWTVKAIIQGMAESDTITFNFEQIFDDFEVSFSEDNRRIAVGPLKSFMEQLVPDGFHVRLSVFKENQLIQTISKQTLSGKVNFMLNPDILPEGNYTIKINTAGLEKVINSRQLW